jgi:hypothetical protein
MLRHQWYESVQANVRRGAESGTMQQSRSLCGTAVSITIHENAARDTEAAGTLMEKLGIEIPIS